MPLKAFLPCFQTLGHLFVQVLVAMQRQIDSESDRVHCILDPCHMIKLVRNTADLAILKTSTGEVQVIFSMYFYSITRFLTSRFFHKSTAPRPLINTLKYFRFLV
jgi:hypothetical protein